MAFSFLKAPQSEIALPFFHSSILLSQHHREAWPPDAFMSVVVEHFDFHFGNGFEADAKWSIECSVEIYEMLKLRFNFNVDTSGQVEFHERIDSLLSRLKDIQKPLMSPNFELFAGLLIYMR